MSYLGKKVLVTGAGGFIGSHLVEQLALDGAAVTALLHYNALSSIGNLKYIDPSLRQNIEFIFGNIEDSEFVRSVSSNKDVIFHLAALIAIPYSYLAPRSYVNTNVTGTLNVLEAARSLQTPKIIHTSTSEVYGTAIYEPICERHPLQGQSPYSATKIAADKIAESYYRSFDLPVVTIRPFNTFGPRQSARAFIPTIISQALVSDKIKLGDLSPMRDLTYVLDTVKGFMNAGLSNNSNGEVINLGTGSTQSVGTVAEEILRLIGGQKKIEIDQSRIRPEKSEVMKLISNNSKARELLGWMPEWKLSDGLSETISFVRQNLSEYNSSIYNV